MAKDLLEDLLERRDAWRKEMNEALTLVSVEDAPWETNKQGKMQWYLHPALMNKMGLRTLLVWRQEIPAGSHSGKQRTQGGILHYVLKGKGYTVLDGVRHDWEAGDAIVFPFKWNGVEYQHFNVDTSEPLLMIATMLNQLDIIGVDQGCGFEQLENAPEYRE